jgi:hypothetical protein
MPRHPHTPPSHVTLSCPGCESTVAPPATECKDCEIPLIWRCTLSDRQGQYKSLSNHLHSCIYCSPERREQLYADTIADKENLDPQILEAEQDTNAETHIHLLTAMAFTHLLLDSHSSLSFTLLLCRTRALEVVISATSFIEGQDWTR